jgi:hypothetical protein
MQGPSQTLRPFSCSLVGAVLLAAVGTGFASPSVARQWNEEILAAIRIDRPNPPVHARNLFHLATAMWDAWAAYDSTAVGYIFHERAVPPAGVTVAAARESALSMAAYRILKPRYANSPNAGIVQPRLAAKLTSLGYDVNFTSTAGSSPAALGNRIAQKILAWGLNDGSGQGQGFSDPSYVNTQPEFRVLENGVPLGGYPAGSNPDVWHPLTFDDGFAQNGVGPITLQTFVGVSWLGTRPWTLTRSSPAVAWIDPGPPARLSDPLTAPAYKAEALAVLADSKGLGNVSLVNISPGVLGANPVGTESGMGHPVNPSTGLPYPANQVPEGDYARVLAEYWADGPNSETPPGHWHALANHTTDQLTQKRIGGQGPVVDDLEWDVKLYFALAGATHDAACAAWSLKRIYNSPRPLSMIRGMALHGQSSDPNGPSYSPLGLPLVPGLTGVVTAASLAPGGVYAGLGFQPGEVLVYTWPGRPEDPTAQRSLPGWIRGVDWFPFQSRTFVSPAFPGYVSGHSTFSRAAAEVLSAITGSEFFPGGLGTFTAPAGTFLKTEFGPSVTVQLQWATYFDAADEAGRSRRWGGIHPRMDDLPGRVIGQQCGRQSWQRALQYFSGSILHQPLELRMTTAASGSRTLHWDSVPGLWYKVEHSQDLAGWQPLAAAVQALEPQSQWIITTLPSVRRMFFRVSQMAEPN